MRLKRTNRGFPVYGEFHDAVGCEVRLQQSSEIARVPFAWLFTKDVLGVYSNRIPGLHDMNIDPKLDVKAARKLIRVLQRYIDDVVPPRIRRPRGRK